MSIIEQESSRGQRIRDFLEEVGLTLQLAFDPRTDPLYVAFMKERSYDRPDRPVTLMGRIREFLSTKRIKQ